MLSSISSSRDIFGRNLFKSVTYKKMSTTFIYDDNWYIFDMLLQRQIIKNTKSTIFLLKTTEKE